MASSPAQTYFWHTRTAPAPAARFSSCRAGPVARRAGGRWHPRRLPPEPPRSGLDDTHSSLGLTRDDELGIDLRTTLGGGGGRYLRQTNSSAIGVFGQLLYNREKGAERKDDRNSLEASLNVLAEWFRYDDPELDITTSAALLPSLTEFGRLRSEFELDAKWEIVSDLYWRLTFYNSFDSDPPTEGAPKT